MGHPSSISTSSPTPTSMLSSFEGEQAFILPQTTSSPPQNVSTGPPSSPLVAALSGQQHHGHHHHLTSIQEYNLQQLASLAEKHEMVGDPTVVVPSTNPSPTPSFTLADLFGDLNSNSHAMNNLQALAKLGTLGNQGAFALPPQLFPQNTQQKMNKKKYLSDVGSVTLSNGGGLVLGRGPSPGIIDSSPGMSTLAASNQLNGGFQSISSSTSPIHSLRAGIYLFDFFLYSFNLSIFHRTCP